MVSDESQPRWKVGLTGDPHDLRVLMSHLRDDSGRATIEKNSGAFYIWNKDIVEASTSDGARQAAKLLASDLSVAFQAADLISAFIAADGAVIGHGPEKSVSVCEEIKLGFAARVELGTIVVRADGRVDPGPPSRGLLMDRFLALHPDLRADVATLTKRGVSLVELNPVFEHLKAVASGRDDGSDYSAIESKGLATSDELGQLWATLTVAKHRGKQHGGDRSPAAKILKAVPPLRADEARSLLLRILNGLVKAHFS